MMTGEGEGARGKRNLRNTGVEPKTVAKKAGRCPYHGNHTSNVSVDLAGEVGEGQGNFGKKYGTQRDEIISVV